MVKEMELFKNNKFEPKDDEYQKHGVYYCSKCNTPRQCFLEKDFSVRIPCECQKLEFKMAEELAKQEQQNHEIKVLKNNSLLSERYKNSTFESLDINRSQSFLKAVETCKAYCDKWQEYNKKGLGLFIYGNVGTGKTELSACICNELTSKLVPVLITNFFEILKRIRSVGYENEGEIIDSLTDVNLLILDDLGTENLLRVDGRESALQEKIYDILNWRYNKKKPTIFTSNCSLKELEEKRGLKHSILDRISAMSVAILNIEGNSYRMNEIK